LSKDKNPEIRQALLADLANKVLPAAADLDKSLLSDTLLLYTQENY
jgi:hypothetical protein